MQTPPDNPEEQQKPGGSLLGKMLWETVAEYLLYAAFVAAPGASLVVYIKSLSVILAVAVFFIVGGSGLYLSLVLSRSKGMDSFRK